ncbi:MAG: hypothetical protein QXU87_04335 [Candidatus Caldarchaeum sp.]
MDSKIREYLELKTGAGVSYVKYSLMDRLPSVRSIIFDCDGVLIDEKTSYDQVIRDVAARLVTLLTGFKMTESMIPPDVIYRIRSVGSFNNDCDTITLLVEWVVKRFSEDNDVNLQNRLEKFEGKTVSELGEILKSQEGLNKLSEKHALEWFKQLEKRLSPLEGTAAALREVESELGISSEDVAMVRKILNYPGKYGDSLLTTVFEEAFFGSDEASRLRGLGPFFSFEGRLKNERLLVNAETLEKLYGRGISMGISTGRGSWETWKTLGPLSEFFEKKACVFVGDLVTAEPDKREKYEKPSPWSLLEAVQNLPSQGDVLFLGNSVEDYVMFTRAKPEVDRLLFGGVYGVEQELAYFFIEGGADAVIPNVNILPKIIELLEEG